MQINESVRFLKTRSDGYQAEIIAEIEKEFRDYRHYDVGFGGLLKSMVYGISDEVLADPEFRREVKYELKLVMNYLHLVRDRNTIREIKTSTFPMLLVGAAGNRTMIKLIMISTYLSAKAMPFVADTFEKIMARAENQDPRVIETLYARMLSNLRLLATRENFYMQKPPSPENERKLAAFARLRLRKKNELRATLGLSYLIAQPDDPYRALPLTRVKGEGID